MMKDLMERLDNNMEFYRDNKPFFMAYKNSRKIYNYNSATKGLEGYVKDAETGQLLKHCLIEVLMPTGNRQTSTNTKAHYSFKRLEMERCTIRVRALHYTTAEFDITLEQDKMTHYDIMMIAEPVTTPTPAPVNA